MKQYKFVVVGAGGVGKSAITVQFVQGTFLEKYDPTIEDSYRKQVDCGGEACLLEILDTAGQEELSSMRDVYMKNGQGFILVYSITAKDSFEDVQDIRKNILRSKDGEEVPMVLVGNKMDLEDQRIVKTEDGRQLASSWANCDFLETSAKTKHNVSNVFMSLVKKVNEANAAKHDDKPKKRCNIL